MSAKTRTQEELFIDMFRELRAWNPDISESPERMDPILRVLLQLYASQLSKIDRRIDRVWDIATTSLVRSVCPETRRWPIPAYTVMKCELRDPVVEIDTYTKFYYKEAREGGGLYFFTPIRTERMVAARVTQVFTVADGAPQPMALTYRKGTAPARTAKAEAAGPARLFVGVEFSGLISELGESAVFLRGDPVALKLLQWARWRPSNADGTFNKATGFCPGQQNTIEEMFADQDGNSRLWGSMRSSADIFRPLENSFVVFPTSFCAGWKPVPPGTLLDGAIEPPPSESPAANTYWIELTLPERGDRHALLDGISLDFGCFVATNRNELTVFKHTAGNRVIDVELPEPIDSVLEITAVTDANGNDYLPRYEISDNNIEHTYTLQDTNDHLVLWFDFSSKLTLPPESITVRYAVTDGLDGNGIDPNRVTELYENHPGIVACKNLSMSRGAMPSKTQDQIVTEVSTRLRSRNRALTYHDIIGWVRTFDNRIRRVECENGIQRSASGVRRCIVVRLEITESDFYSRDEIELLRRRLNGFLKARSPVNTHFEIEVVRL